MIIYCSCTEINVELKIMFNYKLSDTLGQRQTIKDACQTWIDNSAYLTCCPWDLV